MFSNFSVRLQIVHVNNTSSRVCNVKIQCRVSQGVLFFVQLYIRMVSVQVLIPSVKVLLYADDTGTLFFYSNPKIIAKELS